jgi:plastocyanin
MKKIIGTYFSYVTVITFLIAVLAISNSCTKDTSYSTNDTSGGTKGAGPGINEIWIQGMAFTPATITVTAGTTITWTNKDAVSHTVTGTTGLFDSGSVGNGEAYSFKFATVGTFSYYCKPHPSMTATVIVK